MAGGRRRKEYRDAYLTVTPDWLVARMYAMFEGRAAADRRCRLAAGEAHAMHGICQELGCGQRPAVVPVHAELVRVGGMPMLRLTAGDLAGMLRAWMDAVPDRELPASGRRLLEGASAALCASLEAMGMAAWKRPVDFMGRQVA